MGRSTANQHFSGQPNFEVWIQDPKLLYGQALSFLQKIEGQCGFCNDGCLTEVSSAFFYCLILWGTLTKMECPPKNLNDPYFNRFTRLDSKPRGTRCSANESQGKTLSDHLLRPIKDWSSLLLFHKIHCSAVLFY